MPLDNKGGRIDKFVSVPYHKSMDQNVLPPQETANIQKKIPFVKIGAIIIFLILLFTTILYLNASKQKPNIQESKNILDLISPTISQQVPEYAKADTSALISDILIADLIPNNIIFEKQDVENPNNYTFYGTGWTGKNGETFVVTIEYDEKQYVIDRQILIHVKEIVTDLNSVSSTELTKKYIKFSPPTPFKCISLSVSSKFCEVFWTDTDIKKGIDITSPAYGLNETQIFYCEHHTGTPAYDWKSCNPGYKNTGI